MTVGNRRAKRGSGIRVEAVKQTWLRAASITILAFIFSSSSADVSLRLSSVSPGWEKLESYGRDAGLHDPAVDLAESYARQLGRFCSLPEVFLRESSNSILSAKLFYEAYLPHGSREEVLLESADQRVSIVHMGLGSGVLTVMVVVDRTGTVLILCG